MAAEPTQGVTDTEIVIGTVTDLSGVTAIQGGVTPMNDATWPMALEKNVPTLLALTAARSMYKPFNRLKFSQTSSYVDQMRAGVKYFVERRSKKTICIMYQDTDFGRDVQAGVQLQAEAENLKVAASTARRSRPTPTSRPT